MTLFVRPTADERGAYPACPVIWRYDLPDEDSWGGWALLVLSADGFFAAVSDYGNYAFRWTQFGPQDFRRFIAQVNPDYVYSKLSHTKDVVDSAMTASRIRGEIESLTLSGHLSQDVRLEEIQLLEEFEEQPSVEVWLSSTSLQEAWYLIETKPEPQCWAFCTRVLPRLQARLREELANEGSS